MERYSEYLKEDKEEIIKDLHVVIIGLSDDEGTFADLMQSVAKKKALKVNMVDIDQAYIASSDVEKGSVTIHNWDGEDGHLDISIHNSIIFVRAGAIKNLTAQALVSSMHSIGFFMVNDLQAMTLCDNKMASTIELERNNMAALRVDKPRKTSD